MPRLRFALSALSLLRNRARARRVASAFAVAIKRRSVAESSRAVAIERAFTAVAETLPTENR